MDWFDENFPTRLAWRHTTGIARHDGVCAKLRAPPAIGGMDCMTEMEFVPRTVAQVRIGCDQVRDMTDDEQDAAMRLLAQMSTDAIDALDGQSTVVVVVRR